MRIQCPACDEHFIVSVKPEDPRKRVRSSDSPLVPSAMRAVLGFMRHIGPGRYSNAELFERYSTGDYVELSQQAFVRALSANGATRWRTASGRGWQIPEIPEDQRPAHVAPSTAERVVGRKSTFVGPIAGHEPVFDDQGLVKGWAPRAVPAPAAEEPQPLKGMALAQQMARDRADRERAEDQLRLAEMHGQDPF